MGEKIVVGPINKGLRTGVTPFNIDNDSFPYLVNAYQWRGRVKRKRGTSLLGRLRRYFNSSSISYSSTATINLVAGSANILTGFGLQVNGNIIPGTVTIVDSTAGNTYTDTLMNGTLQGAPTGTGTINYATGVITITGGLTHTISVVFTYYPDLPVMGLRDLILGINQFPGTLGFDTVYSYNILPVDPYSIYDVSWYKNPASATYPSYVRKTNSTRTSWNGQNYQQFYTVNYQGALWATNGINIPFSVTNVGMQFKPIVAVTVTSGGPPAIVNLEITGHGLSVGDFLFINEVSTTTGINFQTGYVTTVVDANNVTVEFPNATIATNGTGGIAQYLTNRSDNTIDCLRWYDGDPTDGNVVTPSLTGINGWVNFAPPLSLAAFSIADAPARQYYLVGARTIIPYKDRLLFFGPVIQSSSGSKIYLQDTVIYSQNGTPYYTVSYTNSPSATVDTPTNPPVTPPGFVPILVPVNQTATPSAWFEDQTGFGGFLSAGIDQPITSSLPNEDVIIVGFDRLQARLVYTGNDIVPFNFFTINSELGTSSTFSGIIMDKGIISRGNRGIIITSQVDSARIDLEIPDQVFEFNLLNNGTERVTSQRDFINEWIYITYLGNENTAYIFPNQTLIYNYRDSSWGVFNESYTTYGQFRKQTGFTWATVGNTYPTWNDWNDPWNAGQSTLKQAQVIGGNSQGFVIYRDVGTGEANSLYIRSFTGSLVSCPGHCLNEGDYIIIKNAIGTIANEVNGKIFSVSQAAPDSFTLNPAIGTGTYFGGATIQRMYVPYIQTKQFPPSWGIARKTRIGVQQYLLTKTPISQIQLLIFLSQDDNNPYNNGPIVPDISSLNNSLIYSTILYTCPESTNLGLTPANINLQMLTGSSQEQIWHRINTSLLGDTVQLGLTMSDEQMRSLTPGTPSFITGATQSDPCILTCSGGFSSGQLILIEDVGGMTELNGNTYVVFSSTLTTVTIGVDSSMFDAFTASFGTATPLSPINQFAEIELHSIIIDVSPSMLLA